MLRLRFITLTGLAMATCLFAIALYGPARPAPVIADTSGIVTEQDTTVSADTLEAPGEPDDTLTSPPESLRDIDDEPGMPQQEGGAGEPPVEFEARDSVVFDYGEEQIVYLYGNAEVRHPKGTLESGKIVLNLSSNIMEATTSTPDDTLTHPVLSREGEEIRSRRIRYNYVTDKGTFDAARVTIDRGGIQGEKVKRTSPDVVFVDDGQYSTCELDHPHFYIQASRMKVFEEDEIFFSNAQLYILDIPYPIIFPFGYIPSRLEQEQTGFLEPTYTFQDQQRRGIGLQNLGWFQEFNPYLTGQVSFDVFTSGSFFIDGQLNYRRTQQYNGSIQIGYSQDRGLESTDPDFAVNEQRSLRIQHSQDINPFSRISANVNLRTQDYFGQNSYDISDRASTTSNSNISYNFNHPENRYSFRVSSRINQNFSRESVTLSGPDVSFSTPSMTPFERTGPGAGESWYETFSFRYSSSFNNRFRYNPIEDDPEYGFFDTLFDRDKHEQVTGEQRYIDFGIDHSLRGNTQLLTSEYVNLSSSFNVNEYWVPQTIRRYMDEETGQTETEVVPGIATSRDFNVSSSLNTRLYGISNARIGSLDGFRHTFNPSLSYSYNPDFSAPFWGVYREVEGDPEGNKYSTFEGSPVGGPSAGESQSISLSISNRLETRHVTRDSTGEQSSEVLSLVDDLRASISYNFAADQFKLSNLSTRFRTSIFDNVNLNASANFEFYARDEDYNRYDRFMWEEDQGIMRLTDFSITASTSFSGGEGGRPEFSQSQAHFPAEYDPLDQSRFTGWDRAFNSQPVQRIHAPWSFRVNFNYGLRRDRSGDFDPTATLSIRNISIQLTPEWQVGTETGYDFVDGDLTPSRFRISRTLHCWNLSFEWNPFDDFPYYMFRLTVNDSQIQSLFQKLPGLNNLERTQSPINRRR